MSVGLAVSSKVVANARVSQGYLHPLLGAYELVFQIDLMPTPLHERPWWLSPQSMRVKVRGGAEREIGLARPDRLETVHQNNGAYPQSVCLKLSLHPHQLAVLEDERDGQDLEFVLTLFGEGGAGANIREGFQAELRFTFPLSRWIEQLRAVGALDVVLLEIPMPVGPSSGAQAAAAKRLRQAQTHFAGGNYDDCVGACRLAFDELGVTGNALGLFGAGQKNMAKNDRGRAMLAAVRFFTHPAHHAGPEVFSRAEAKLVLQITAACIAADPF